MGMNGTRRTSRMNPERLALVSPRTLVVILGLAGFISAADNWFVSPVLPAIAADFGVSIPVVGMILTAYLIPYGFMQPVFGVISDKIGKIRILLIILLGFAIGSGACALAGSLPSLMIWRVCTGFFAAGIIAVSLAHIGDTIPETDRQRYVGIFMGIVFLGQGLSVGIGGILTNFLSWRVPFMLFSLIAILDLLLLRMLTESHPRPSAVPLIQEVNSICHDQRSWIFFPLAGAVGFFLIGVYSYLGAYLHQVIGTDYLQTGFVMMFFGFSALFGGVRAGYLGQRYGYRRMISGGAIGALVSVILTVLLPCRETGILVSAGLGFGYVCIQSTIATRVFEISPTSKGLPSALVGLGLFGGAGMGTALMGILIGISGYPGPLLLFAAGMFGIVIVSILIPEEMIL